MTLKIIPKCCKTQELATNAKGFLIPCCWLGPNQHNDVNFKKLVQDKFHLDKVDKISDVVNSDEWQEFKNNLLESNISKLPSGCIRNCSEDKNYVNGIEITFNKDTITKNYR